MAFYTYRCTCSNEDFEVIAKPSEIPLKICPKCGKENPQRVYSSIMQNWNCGGRYGTSTYWDNKNKK